MHRGCNFFVFNHLYYIVNTSTDIHIVQETDEVLSESEDECYNCNSYPVLEVHLLVFFTVVN